MKKLLNIKPVNTNEAYQKILYWFFSFPQGKIGLSDLAKNLKISKSTANRDVNRLVNEGFLEKEIVGKSWRLSCNLGHAYNKSKKIGYNLNMVYESDIVKEIHKEFGNPKAIVLFGSYRKGDDIESSDIDIAVEVLSGKSKIIDGFGVIGSLGYRKNVAVNVHLYTKEGINTNLYSNIVNGIVLDGFLEVKK
jgi:predicted nucleotidyltransferase/predicted transcriptional regulator